MLVCLHQLLQPSLSFFHLHTSRCHLRTTATPRMMAPDGGAEPQHTTASAAEEVRRARATEAATRKARRARSANAPSKGPQLETVSTTMAASLDEGEVARRQREVQATLEAKEAEVRATGESLARVRKSLLELEAPLKRDVMRLREQLEAANRTEATLVDAVNNMRKTLHVKEGELAKVRENKDNLADQLIGVLADFEKRKAERLEEIAHLVGGDAPRKATPKAEFQGF